MVNLMVGIAIGLSVLSAATFWVQFQWQHSRQILQSSRSQQEISVLMQTLVHYLRRANFQSSKVTNLGTQGPFCSSPFCGAAEDFDVSAHQILFSIDRNENGLKENNECSGFRFYANQIQIKTSCKPVVWTALTKFQNLDILAFEVQLHCDPFALNQVVLLNLSVRSQLASAHLPVLFQRLVQLRNASTRANNFGPNCPHTGT